MQRTLHVRDVGAVVALLMVSGCGQTERQLWIDFPAVADAQSEIISVKQGSVTTFAAYDFDAEPIMVANALVSGEPVAIEAWVYAEPLASLGLSSGRLTPSSGAGPSFRLPRTSAVFALSLSGDEAPAAFTPQWRPSPPSPELESFKVDGVDPRCARMIATPSVEFDGNADFAVGIDDQRALIGVGNDEAFMVGVDLMETVTLSPSRPSLRAALRTDDGQLWFGNRDGRLYRGTLEDGALTLSVLTSTDSFSSVIKLTGGFVEGRIELFALHKNGEVTRFRDGERRLLHSFEGDNDQGLGAIIRLGPDDVVAGWAASATAIRVTNAEVRMVPTMSVSGLTAGAMSPTLGVVLGTGDGGLLVGDGAAFAPITDAATIGGIGVNVLAPLSEGILYGGQLGSPNHWVPDFGTCPDLPGLPHRSDFLVPIGRDVVGFGDVIGAPRSRVTVLRRL